MVNDGLWDVYNDFHMGQTAELVAEKYGITRRRAGRFAVASHQKAAAAWREGRFAAEVVPVEIPAKKKGAAPKLFERDESIREDTSLEDAARAQACVQEGWHRDGGECSGRERRVGRCCHHVRGEGESAGADADGAHRGARDERRSIPNG